MRPLLQYSLGSCLFCLTIVAVLSHDPAIPARGFAADKASAEQKAYTETIPGSAVKFDMVAIPGGTFVMGSPANEAGRQADEGPQHPVTIRPFWMGKTEVTWVEFDQYWKQEEGAKRENQKPEDKAADAVSRPTPPYADETFGHGREGHPVLCITHHAAMEYCRWLSAKTGKSYRLPTEAEWEYACRAGTKTAYFFGDDPKKLGEHAWIEANANDMPHPVAMKKPNAWGLYDMHGNVAEWCIDQFDAKFYGTLSPDKPTLLPVKLPGERRFHHLARGGSWIDPPERCRS